MVIHFEKTVFFLILQASCVVDAGSALSKNGLSRFSDIDTQGDRFSTSDGDASSGGSTNGVPDAGDNRLGDIGSADSDLPTGGASNSNNCGPLAEGQTETRTFYEVPSVPPDQSCVDRGEVRSRICTNSTLSAFTGTYPYASCYVRSIDAPRPVGNFLENYVLESTTMSVTGVGDNLSGATWNPLTGTFFAAVNNARVVEFLPPVGTTITLKDSWVISNIAGQDDYEGISWVDGDIFVLSDERNDRAVFVRIQPGTGSIDLNDTIFVVRFPDQSGGNSGLEGIGFTPDIGQCGGLFAVQEVPYELYRFVLPCVTFGIIDMSADLDYSLADRNSFRLPGFGQSKLRNCYWTGSACGDSCNGCDKIDIKDFAGVVYVPSTGRVIVVSENVGIKTGGVGTTQYIDLLIELGEDANGQWGPTWMTTLPNHQAEGVTIGAENEILVVSEPNLVLRLRVP